MTTRSTCTITIPPEFFVACAIESMSKVAASRSIVTLPCSSAVVPRRNATSIGRRRIEEELLALELDDPHHLLRRLGVHATALHARVDERAEADPCDEARPAGGRLAVEMATSRPAGGSRPRSARRSASVPSAGTSPQCAPIARRTSPSCARWLSPRAPPSPCPAANTSVRSRGPPRRAEALLECDEELLGNGDPDEPTDRQRVTVEDELGGRLGRDDLRPLPHPLIRESCPAHSRSRSSNFGTLPVEVFGSSSRKATALGAL